MSLARTMPLLLVILLADSPFVHSQAQSTDNPESVHFRAGYFATPLMLHGDPISSIEIRCESLLPQGGKGIFCVEQGVVEFNDFGDATIKESRKHDYQVIFARLAEEDIADRRRRQVHNRRLYKIVFDDGVWNEIFFLNLSNDGAAVPRLVQQYDPNVPVGRRTVRRLFALTNLGFKKDSALDERIENDLSLRTVYVELQPGKPTSGIRIRGTIGGDGTFSHDDNHITYSDYGDLGMQTLRGFLSPKMKLVEQKLEDPLDQGRRLLEVHLSGRIYFSSAAHAPLAAPETQLSVVVSPQAGGQHRLIIQQDGNITHVLPLVDDLWQQFAKKTAALTNPRSIAAVKRLRALFRNGLTFHVSSGEVATLTYSGDITDVALKELENFPRLTELTIAGYTKLTEHGFAALKEANSINTISFQRSLVSDAILFHVCQLPNLQKLRIQDNRTAAYTEAGQQVTDNGLKELSRLTELHSLTLSGGKITDQGLASLKKLDRLNHLRLVQTSVTPASFIKLGGSMSCTGMDLHCYRSEEERHEITYRAGGQELRIHGFIDPGAYKEIPQLMKLKLLHLPDSATENDLKEISMSSTLRSLSLSGNLNITSDGLKHLTTLSRLEDLNLRNCLNLQDDSIASLKQLASLRKLNLSRTKISQSAMDQLEVALPECQLIRR